MVGKRGLLGVAVEAVLVATPAARAEWSDDPALNLVLGDLANDQVQPKLAPTADGGFYVSWFDNAAGGYDVRLQRVDAAGNEMWAHNGVLVADRGFSSTQDYGLAVDHADTALVAFNDDRGATESVTVAGVGVDGTPLWGATGVQVAASGTLLFGPPAVAVASDGFAVVAWSQDGDVVVQKLDAAGAPQWGSGVTLVPAAGSYYVGNLHPADGGSVILSIVTYSSRHLLAQKLGADGSLLWGSSPVAVFDGGSLGTRIFGDGFETGSTGGWSVTAP